MRRTGSLATRAVPTGMAPGSLSNRPGSLSGALRVGTQSIHNPSLRILKEFLRTSGPTRSNVAPWSRHGGPVIRVRQQTRPEESRWTEQEQSYGWLPSRRAA